MDLNSYLLIALIICFLFVQITNWWNNRKDRKNLVVASEQTQAEKIEEKETDTDEKIRTRDLFLKVLEKIGCQYQLEDEEDEDARISFVFQGEHMYADASNDSIYIVVWDPFWENVELSDIDEVSRMRKAINKSNLNCSVTTVYTFDKADNSMDVHSQSTFPFIPQMWSIEEYLKVELGEFFRAHQLVGIELQKLRTEDRLQN